MQISLRRLNWFLKCWMRFAVVSIVSIFSVAGAATAPSLNVNLLVNPDAEAGTTAGWTCPDRPWVAAAEVTPHGGSLFFWPGGGSVADTSMYQDVDVSGLSSINSGALFVHLSGWLANWDQYPNDRATLSLYAFDASGNTLDFRSADHRSPAWTQYRIDRPIPAGTTKLRVMLTATRFVGSDDDGYFDDLSLVINNSLGASTIVTSPNNQAYANSGSTLQLRATTSGGQDSSYIWSSSFSAIATVDQNGLLTGVSAGRATIQARGKDTGASGVFDVTVMGSNGLILIEPSATSQVVSGSRTQITWRVIGSLGTAALYLSKDGGVNFSLLSNIDNPASGSYTWTVPSSANTTRNAMLKLTYSGGESVSALFSIVPPPAVFAAAATAAPTSLGVTLTDTHATGFEGDVYFTGLLPATSPIFPRHLQRDGTAGMIPVSFGRSGYKQTGPTTVAEVHATGPISTGTQYTIYERTTADPMANSGAIICMGLTVPVVSAKGQALMRVVATGDKIQGVVQCPTVQTLTTTKNYTVQTSGPITSRTITATITPLDEHRGQVKNIYSWAVIPDGQQVMQTKAGWALMADPMEPAMTLKIPASGLVTLPVTDRYDLSSIIGTLVYVGIGSSWDEVKSLNQAGHYYTVQP